MTRRSWMLLIAIAALWGSSYMSIKVALEDLPAAWVVMLRTLLGGLAIIPFAIRHQLLQVTGKYWRALTLNGCLQVAVPFLLISIGEQHVSSSLAGVLVASVPVFTVPIASYWGSEDKLTASAILGILTGMLGVILLFGLDLSGTTKELFGGALIVLASVSYAVSGVFVQRKLRSAHSTVLATTTIFSGMLLVTPLAMIQPPASIPHLETLAAIMLLGVGSTGIAFMLFFSLLKEVGPTRSSTVTYLAPVFAMFYGVLLLGEQITFGGVVGLCAILLGCLLVTRNKKKQSQKQDLART